MSASDIRRAVAGILLALSLAACGDDPASFELQTIEKGAYSGIVLGAPLVFKIDSQAEWDDFWARHKIRESPTPAQPAIDFAQHSVVAVVDKQESSGGFTMEVDSVTEQDAALHVHATRTEPGPDCVVATVLTQPFHIVRIGRSVLPAVLELSVTTSSCAR